MELTDLPIPSEEYPLVAFGVTWLIDHVMASPHRRSGRPVCVLVDEVPTMAGAEYDLIYWWHKSIEHFPGLENRARIRMLRLAKETKRFDPSELGKYIEVAASCSLTNANFWKFRVSRIGIDTGARQAIGHFFVTLDEMWLNWGCILVMEWGDDDVICLKTVRHTISPGK
jgi:hypothetical protein